MTVDRKDWVPDPEEKVSVPDLPKHVQEILEAPRVKLVDPTTLDGQLIPERHWIVQDWIPAGYTTALYGNGGTGKSLLAQQLMTACATEKPWAGLAVKPCRVLGLFCEDSEEELHRRQDAINRHYGIDFRDLDNMRWVSGVGADNVLMNFSLGAGQLMPRYLELLKAVKDFKAELVVIDTAADTFGGNENDRSQVRQFIGHALNKMAVEIKGAVLLCAHPSRSGLSQSGDLDGGSTAWSNSVRSRLSLSHAKAEEGGQETDERVLRRHKANYAARHDEVKLAWERGVLKPVEKPTGFKALAADAHADGVFLKCLDEAEAAGRYVSESNRASNYAPKAFAKSPNRSGLSAQDFTRAMERLFATKLIVAVEYNRFGSRRIMRVGQTEREADPAED